MKIANTEQQAAAERLVLASVIQSPDKELPPTVRLVLDYSEKFCDADTSAIAAAIRRAVKDGKSPDLDSVAAELSGHDLGPLAALTGSGVGLPIGLAAIEAEALLKRLKKSGSVCVKAKRQTVADEYVGDNEIKGGETVSFPEPETWRESVDGAALLNEIRAVLRRFVVAPDSALAACALFALHTYAFDLGDISPILFITGPTKRCGKSRLLSVLARLVNRPLTASSASAAGIYRTIELHRPTLLIDEVDSFLKGDEQLRGLVNSGHTRDAAFHLGCVAVGRDFEPRRWSTWTPKVLSGIGRLADTIEDRAVMIRMRRRRKDEAAERLRHGIRFEELRSKCARFVADNEGAIHAANPAIPDMLNDRAADNWTPLLVLADLAGGEWPNKARQAALELSGNDDTDALGINAQLLADIRHVFDEQNTDRLASKALCDRLAELEGRPWAEFGKNQKAISPNQLANLLREFGIASRGVRIGDTTPKGYLRDDFADVFSSYLPGNGESKRHNATKPASIDVNPLFQSATPEACCASEKATLANNGAGCCGVAFPKVETSPDKLYV